MSPYSKAGKADVRPRMSPPNRQSGVEIARKLGIHAIILYKWRKAWRLQGEVVPANEKEAESWSSAEKLTVVLETASMNTTERVGYCSRADSKFQSGLGSGCLIAIVSSAVMSCITACMPALID